MTAAELNEPDAAETGPADGGALPPGGRIVVVDGPRAAPAVPGPYPDGLTRLLGLVALHMPKDDVDAVWAFPGVKREGREYGVAVVSRMVRRDGPTDGRTDGSTSSESDERLERRRVYRARYVLELKGEKRGTAQLELEEAALTPAALVHKVIEGVARRADEAGDAELVDLAAWKAGDGHDAA